MPNLDHIERRPSPDALLRSATEEERRHKGKLKVFLGAAPGVGKTYAMLEAGRTRMMSHVDVVVGVVETHGRSETAELILGLDIVPRCRVEYQGRMLEEMDLDAILNRRPQLVLVDELAHTNAPGSRHPKRYMDVEELLDAGIDVYTTLNIQHLESLNDAVAQITGIRVQETLPDRIMERADEVEFVDVSVEDLLQRLRDGKVYLPEQAERAIRNYFRPGNLSALRQFALRHMAERVDEQMQTYMQAHAIPGPWPATERLLVSVGPSPLSSRLVRATRRRAERRHAEWIAVYVETPAHHRLSEADRNRVAETLRLVEELGGEAVTIPGEKVSDELIRYARAQNVTEIVIGKSHRSWWFHLLHGSIVSELIRKSGEIDVFVITGDEEATGRENLRAPDRQARGQWSDYLAGTVMVTLSAVAGALLRTTLSLPNLSLIYLLAVLTTALRWGLRPSIYVSILSVLVYDFFFVPPYYRFTISSSQDVVMLLAFLLVAVLTSNLTSRVRDQADAARKREARTAALYGFSRALAGASGLDDVLQVIATQLSISLRARVIALLPSDHGLVQSAAAPQGETLSDSEIGSATWAWQHRRMAGHGTDTLPGESWVYAPLHAPNGAVGVLAFRFESGDVMIDPDQRRMVEALCDQAAVAVERARFARDIEQSRLLSERERLQAILLSSISHDLRTPLASIIGSASSLLDSGDAFPPATRRELLSTILEEAERLNRFVGNLLDSTRLESGAMRLNRDWADVSDIVGSAIRGLASRLANNEVRFEQEPGLPMIEVDFVLMEQVFINLIDNAAKHSPPGAPIRIVAMHDAGNIVLRFIDEGIGVPKEDLERIFDKFFRVQRGDRQMAGTGLGLSICRGIVEEHGGRMFATSPAAGGKGTEVTVILPIGSQPPASTVEPEEQ